MMAEVDTKVIADLEQTLVAVFIDLLRYDPNGMVRIEKARRMAITYVDGEDFPANRAS